MLPISILFGNDLCKLQYKAIKDLSLIKYPSPELFPNFVTIDEFPGVFHRTTLDNYVKIRMTSVKLKNEIILTLKNISSFMDFIFI